MKDKGKIVEMLKSYKGEDADLCFWIFNYVKRSKDVGHELKIFFENVGYVETEKTCEIPVVYEKKELKRYDSIYSGYIVCLLEMLIKKAHKEHMTEDEFYSELWTRFYVDDFFEDDKSRGFAILCMAKNDMLPYVIFDNPLHMTNKEFTGIINANLDSIKKIRHITNVSLSQKTEITSLLLREIMKTESEREQAVLMAVAFDAWFDKKTKKIKDLIEEIEIEEDIMV